MPESVDARSGPVRPLSAPEHDGIADCHLVEVAFHRGVGIVDARLMKPKTVSTAFSGWNWPSSGGNRLGRERFPA